MMKSFPLKGALLMFYLLKLYHDELSADVELKPGLEAQHSIIYVWKGRYSLALGIGARDRSHPPHILKSSTVIDFPPIVETTSRVIDDALTEIARLFVEKYKDCNKKSLSSIRL